MGGEPTILKGKAVFPRGHLTAAILVLVFGFSPDVVAPFSGAGFVAGLPASCAPYGRLQAVKHGRALRALAASRLKSLD